jgi:uncharacterized phage protein (TIGR01671 family)
MFKLRAWDKQFKTMNEVLYISFRLKTVSLVEIGKKGSVYVTSFKDVKLMQYTGLKDKNGVEIFEGDIIKDYSVYNNGVIGNVIYDIEVAGYWLKTKDSTTCLQSTNSKNYEVIGNINEH